MSNTEKKQNEQSPTLGCDAKYSITKGKDPAPTERGAFNERWRDFGEGYPLEQLLSQHDSETPKQETDVRYCYSREEERQPSILTDHHRKTYLQELISNAAPTAKNPVTTAKPAPTQEEVIRELQKQVKMQELSRLSQLYNEKLCRLKRHNRIRWILTFCAYALVFFGILLLALGDVNIGATLLLAVVLTAIHFLINVSIFGWIIQKMIAADRQLEPIFKRVQELEQSLNK